MRMGAAVIFKICDGEIQTSFRRVVVVGGQLATELPRANIRGILITDEVVIKGTVRNCQREIARLGGRLAHREAVDTGKSAPLKADKLHNDFLAHFKGAVRLLNPKTSKKKEASPLLANPPYVLTSWRRSPPAGPWGRA